MYHGIDSPQRLWCKGHHFRCLASNTLSTLHITSLIYDISITMRPKLYPLARDYPQYQYIPILRWGWCLVPFTCNLVSTAASKPRKWYTSCQKSCSYNSLLGGPLFAYSTYISDTIQFISARHFIVDGTIFYISRQVHSWFTARQECHFLGKHIVIFDIFYFSSRVQNNIITIMVIIFSLY